MPVTPHPTTSEARLRTSATYHLAHITPSGWASLPLPETEPGPEPLPCSVALSSWDTLVMAPSRHALRDPLFDSSLLLQSGLDCSASMPPRWVFLVVPAPLVCTLPLRAPCSLDRLPYFRYKLPRIVSWGTIPDFLFIAQYRTCCCCPLGAAPLETLIIDASVHFVLESSSSA